MRHAAKPNFNERFFPIFRLLAPLDCLARTLKRIFIRSNALSARVSSDDRVKSRYTSFCPENQAILINFGTSCRWSRDSDPKRGNWSAACARGFKNIVASRGESTAKMLDG